MIEEGNCSRALSDRLAALEREQDALQLGLIETPAPVVHLHPRLADIYADKVARLEEALADPAIRGQAADVLRTLITRIELRPNGEGDGIDALLHGDLAQILAYCNAAQHKSKLPEDGSPGSQLSVVAGAGYDHNLRPEQVKMVAGGRTHHNLPPDGRPMGPADVGEVAKQVKVVAGTGTHLHLLFRSAA